jgi:hypothetical protein
MNQSKQVVLAVVMSGSFFAGTAFLRANPTVLAAATPGASAGTSAQRLDDSDHWKFKHMHRALQALHDARKELDDAEDIFHGHKQDAIDHVEKAIHEVEMGLHEQNDEAAVPSLQSSAAQLDDDHFPHVRRALEHLKNAKEELGQAEEIFRGHRDEAISHTEKAMHQLEDGLRVAG